MRLVYSTGESLDILWTLLLICKGSSSWLLQCSARACSLAFCLLLAGGERRF